LIIKVVEFAPDGDCRRVVEKLRAWRQPSNGLQSRMFRLSGAGDPLRVPAQIKPFGSSATGFHAFTRKDQFALAVKHVQPHLLKWPRGRKLDALVADRQVEFRRGLMVMLIV
jgi:hypothetical protein